MQAGLEESVSQTFQLFLRAMAEHRTTEHYRIMVSNPNVIRDLLVLATEPKTAAYRPVIYALVIRLYQMKGRQRSWTGLDDAAFLRGVLQRIIETEDVPDRASSVTEMLGMFLAASDLRMHFVQYLFEQIAKRDARMPMFVQYQAKVISLLGSSENSAAFQHLVELVKPHLVEPNELNVAVQVVTYWSCRPWRIGWVFTKHPSMEVLTDAAMQSVRWFSEVSESLTDYQQRASQLLSLASAAELLLRQCYIGQVESETYQFPDKFIEYLLWCISMLPRWIAVWVPNGFPTETITCVSKAVRHGLRCQSQEQVRDLLFTCVFYGAQAREGDFGDSFPIFWAESYEKTECTRTDVLEIILQLLTEYPAGVFQFLVEAMSSTVPLLAERKEVLLYFLSHTVAFVVNTGDEALIGQMTQIVCEQLSEASIRENMMITPTRLILASKAVALLPAEFSRALVGACVNAFIAPACKALMDQSNVDPCHLILASAATAYLYEWFSHTREPVPLDIVKLMLQFAKVSLSSYAGGIVKLGCTEAMSGEIIAKFYWPAIKQLVAYRAPTPKEAEILSQTLKTYVSCCCDVIEVSKGQISDKLIEECLETLNKADETECTIMLMHTLAFSIPDCTRVMNILQGFMREFPVCSVWGRDIALLLTEMILRLNLSPQQIVVLIDFLTKFFEDDIEVIDLIPCTTAVCRTLQIYACELSDPGALAQLLARLQALVEGLRDADKHVEFLPLYALSILEIQLTELLCGLPFDQDTLQTNLVICCEHKTFVEDYYIWLLTCALNRGKEQLAHLEPEKIVAALQNGTLTDESFRNDNAQYLCCASFPVPDRLCT